MDIKNIRESINNYENHEVLRNIEILYDKILPSGMLTAGLNVKCEKDHEIPAIGNPDCRSQAEQG